MSRAGCTRSFRTLLAPFSPPNVLLAAGALPADSSPEVFSSAFWEIAGKPGYLTWVEIHNLKEAPASGIAHISIHARKKGAPVWEFVWLRPHLAISADALKRSVLRPLKIRGAYPERYQDAFHRWEEEKKKGTATICETSIAEALKARQ